jgi:hypothetical protein
MIQELLRNILINFKTFWNLCGYIKSKEGNLFMRMKNINNKELYAGIKKGKLLLALVGCLLLAGCQKGTESEEQKTDILDNSVVEADKVENIEIEDTETTDLPDEDVTVISVLGKEELTIENNRIYSDESELGYLDNRFTSEEIDTILSAIEGTWVVDEYVGFVPYEIGTWSKEEGTEEEKQEKYETTVEQAEENLPDFFFRVENYKSEEPTADGQYIYVYNNNKRYASPMSIALNMQEKGDSYSEFINRTAQGSGIPRVSGYPVIYIDFFSISCSEGENVSYEPATLVLASDGSFLLLKDGAFYSLKHSIQSEIMSGNFEHLNNDSEYVASIEKTYDWVMNGLGGYEWRQLDLNGDGIEDLILQSKKALNSWEHKMILGIFACEEDEASCILWDTSDMTEYYFCGPTGEIMYTSTSYVPIVSFEPYEHCYYDREWNLVTDYELVVYKVDTEEGMKEYPQQVEEWQQEHPDMAEDGIYYRKYTEEGAEILTRQELENIYETVTGYEFHSDFY